MPYVMVPVPEEFAAELQNFLMSLALRAQFEQWSDESVRAVYDEVSVEAQAVLTAVGSSILAVHEPSHLEIATATGLAPDAVLGCVEEIGESSRARKASPLVLISSVWSTGADGSRRERRVLAMTPPTAMAIRDRVS